MSVIDRTQLERQIAIVRMLRDTPEIVAWKAISQMSVPEQTLLYGYLLATRGGLQCQ